MNCGIVFCVYDRGVPVIELWYHLVIRLIGYYFSEIFSPIIILRVNVVFPIERVHSSRET